MTIATIVIITKMNKKKRDRKIILHRKKEKKGHDEHTRSRIRNKKA